MVLLHVLFPVNFVFFLLLRRQFYVLNFRYRYIDPFFLTLFVLRWQINVLWLTNLLRLARSWRIGKVFFDFCNLLSCHAFPQVFFKFINYSVLMHLAKSSVFAILFKWNFFTTVAIYAIKSHLFLHIVINIPLTLVKRDCAPWTFHLIYSLKLAEA